MASDSTKIEAFKILFTEKWSGIVERYLQNLDEIEAKLGDDDEKNALAIEEWVEDYSDLHSAYQEELQTLSEANPLLAGEDVEMGIGGSQAQPNCPSQSLPDMIKNARKKTTKNPEEDQKSDKKS
ncbi:MAG: hypothetical protein JJU32_19895 [Phormidium sp. BM_Day4_Bin.17]|nr:hypothetical protein [Phormidium sp. BM_Day4_Bin.17]UCJ11584.1 MAG: hypothetical protein JWS08_17810 [Phormidium sp. PBR-2020]